MSTQAAQPERNTPTPHCLVCGDPIPPHQSECRFCRRFRRNLMDVRGVVERIIASGDCEAMEAAAGRLTDICLERGI
jgi:hypothetical protein